MIDLLELHKMFILRHLKPGDVAIDFTMGNGHDTEFLSKAVGPRGHVYAFDIQQAAVDSTRERLEKSDCPPNYTLIHASHHLVLDYVKTPIRAGMFNLGWLPGGDKSITTMRETTMPAIEAAISLLDRDGILIIAIYPGHHEGDAEGEMIRNYLPSLPRYKYCATILRILNSPDSPYFFMIEKRNKPDAPSKEAPSQ
ncbi:MAG: class I SAM-dependent methyltransferase [Clostridia bacterium]|nr:class I SAM-dependent methyltransferase [Clostridia bacterium]